MDTPSIPRPQLAVLLASGHHTDIGQVRKINQDSLLVMEMDKVNQSMPSPLGLYVVADGLGGYEGGEIASGLVVTAIASLAQADLFNSFIGGALDEAATKTWLQLAVKRANEAVVEKRTGANSEMGSTLVMAVVNGLNVCLAHVGDSRAYRLNSSGELERLTYDHSLVEELVKAKQLTPAQAKSHNLGSLVYKTIGNKEEVEPDVQSVELEPGDRLILCCDGLNGMISDEQIAAIAHAAPTPAEAAHRLVTAANEAGGRDNITAIVVEISIR
ncbi:MAG: serine/threonine-protein phosphatase [Chloroflexi bacterium]|nr:serine/threonine-protein phosphatase [Chloroflexota bacterium]